MQKDRLKSQMLFEIQQLPFYKHLEEEAITRWIDHVVTTQPERAMWHVPRLFQFGGSEIGILVQAERNLRAEVISDMAFTHTSEYEVFGSKYLKVLPQITEDEAVLSRGTDAEPMIRLLRERTLKQNHRSVIRRPDIAEAIVSAELDKFKFTRVQVDDVWECDGKLLIDDYKAPSESGLTTLLNSEPVTYTAQVTIAKMVANELGYDIHSTQIVPLNWSKYRLDIIDVPFDLAFEAEIIEVCQDRYDKLCAGELPSPSFPKHRLVSPDQMPQDIQKTILELNTWRNINSLASAKIKENDAKLHEFKLLLESQNNDDMRIELGPVNVTGVHKNVFSKEQACEVLKSDYGYTAEMLQHIQNNKTKLASELKKCGLKPREISQRCDEPVYEVDISQSRAPKGDQANLVKSVKASLEESVTGMLDELTSELQEYIELETTDGSLSKRQQRQLKTLKRLTDESEHESVRERASKAIETREPHYDLRNVNQDTKQVSMEALEEVEVRESEAIQQTTEDLSYLYNMSFR
ncbi:hypothetical protein AAFX24_28035 [Vibrio mediterranei]|uniref:hypothetical protein n=1 Tax=Vibrio mediterranei TaxID=689 RepID=UPI0038CED1D3